MKNLNFGDVCGIAICWTGAATVAYLNREGGIIPFIALCAAYYLSKFIVLKKES